jgi:outer membrane murein-binding lipoprotein Lpp
MVWRGECSIGAAYRQVPQCEHAECIAGSIMDQMAIDVQELGAILARLDRMR